MPCYRIVGAANCPYFARAERIGQILACTYSSLCHDIQYEMKEPGTWPAYYTQLCRELGYQPGKKSEGLAQSSDFSSSAPRKTYTLADAAGGLNPDDLPPSSQEGQVLIYNPITKRVVGGESAFKREAYQKYGVQCDITWGQCLAIADENAKLFSSKQAHRAQRPLGIIIAGRPMAGKRTQIPRLVEAFNLVHINCGALIAQAAKRDTENGRYIADFFKNRLEILSKSAKPHETQGQMDALVVKPNKTPSEIGASSNLATIENGEATVTENYLLLHKELVALSWDSDCHMLKAAEAQVPLLPDSIVIPLVISALQSPDVKQRGFILEGFPRTPAQAQAIENAEIQVDSVLVLDLDEKAAQRRLSARLIDPVLNLSYNKHLEESGDDAEDSKLDDLLARRIDDAEDALAVRLRHFELSVIPTLTQFYSDRTTIVDADASMDALTQRLKDCLTPYRS